ncbi:hypothetical protein IWW39_004895 [Coemansia spiralis]|uniref:Uncharacterized protein n=1 Tax=Coemansia spiralis TaxID=417178 RepID=A0A9W8L2Y9_9FUNG|nr:hypothetical protein IWW39_004895 [Coemansia spiralis]
MLFPTQLLRAQSQRRPQFGDRNLPRLDRLPSDKFRGMSRRQVCWTVIIVTVPLVVLYSSIVYKRLVLGEERRKPFREGGLESGYLLDNIASAPRPPRASSQSDKRPAGDDDKN